MNYTIVIQCSPEKKSVIKAAVDFLQALCESSHQVNRVFFYGDAVYLANSNCVSPQDEADHPKELKSLLENYNIPATVCIATAIKRGVLDQAEKHRYEKLGHCIEPPFELGGLGQLVEATVSSDRTITFA